MVPRSSASCASSMPAPSAGASIPIKPLPARKAAEYFARNVAARTGGKVQITVYPAEQLGPGKDVNEMIRQGANVMNITDPGYLSDFVPDVGVLNGPYLIKTPQEYEKLLASNWFKDIEKKLEAAGFKLIMANGF